MKFNIIQKIKEYCDESDANIFKLTAAATATVAIPLLGYGIGSNIVQGDAFDVVTHSVQLTGILVIIYKLLQSAKIITNYENTDLEGKSDVETSLAYFKNELALLKQAKSTSEICFAAFILVNIIYILEAIVNPTSTILAANFITASLNTYFAIRMFKQAKETKEDIRYTQLHVDHYEQVIEDQKKLNK